MQARRMSLRRLAGLWTLQFLVLGIPASQLFFNSSFQVATALLTSHQPWFARIRTLSLSRLQEGLWNDEINGSNNNDDVNNRVDNLFADFQQQPPIPTISTPYAQRQPTASLTPLKVMIFIDGTWLYYSIYERPHNRDVLAQKLGPFWTTEYEIDWSRLPVVACQALLQDKKASWSAIMPLASDSSHEGLTAAQQQQHTPSRPIEVLRVSVYSSMHRDTPEESFRFQMFQKMMEAGFDVNMKETARSGSRGAEKGVDIQLAVDMLYYATVPGAYDVALLVTGDSDFLPAVIRCRQKGRRIGVVSMRSAVALAFEETPNLKDYGIIWLEDYLDQWITKAKSKIPRPLSSRISSDGRKGKHAIMVHPANRSPSDRRISDYTFNKVVTDFITKAGEPRVSSRDLGRHLKELKVGDRALLEEIKAVYGGLYQFLYLSNLYFVFADTRPRVKAFWVSMEPDAEILQGMNDEMLEDLTDEEVRFLVEYKQRPEQDKDVAYEFTLGDQDPPHASDQIDPIVIKPTVLIGGYNQCTVTELKNLCREKGLSVSGKKADLVNRIEEYFAAKQNETKSAMEKVDPSTRLEMIVLEYVHAAGGEANSRDVGRYLVVNKASQHPSNAKNVSALQEMKQLHGGLRKFVEWSTLCNIGRELGSSDRHAFTVVAAKDADRILEDKLASTMLD